MSNNYKEISVCCYSEKANVSIGFGFALDLESGEFNQSLIDNEIGIGASDSFLENVEEFIPGIEKASSLRTGDFPIHLAKHYSRFLDTFLFSFEVDGIEASFTYRINPDELMYSLLEDHYPYC